MPYSDDLGTTTDMRETICNDYIGHEEEASSLLDMLLHHLVHCIVILPMVRGILAVLEKKYPVYI